MTWSDSGDPLARGRRAAPAMSDEGYESFVVRVLFRRRDGHIVRGQLTHLASGRQIHFSEPERLPEMIRRQIARAGREAGEAGEAGETAEVEPRIGPPDGA